MKLLIRDSKDKLYLQICDIIFIFKHELDLPSFVKNDFNDKLSIKNRKGIEDNPYTFKLFTNSDTIEYINGLEYIIDYNEFKNLDEKDIKDKAALLLDKRKELAVDFNKLNVKERVKRQDIVFLYDELEYIVESLRDLVWFKQGHINMIIPGSKRAKKNERKLLKKNNSNI